MHKKKNSFFHTYVHVVRLLIHFAHIHFEAKKLIFLHSICIEIVNTCDCFSKFS